MKSLKILVVDDETVSCEACRLVLTENGHEVVHCITGKDGLNEIRHNTYDLILLDIKLPDIDGTRILKLIQDESLPSCVIVMTGYSTMSSALLTMKLGAADYLAKPFTEDDLLATIKQLFPDDS